MNPGRNPLELVARWGYGARGVVYCLVGSLALLAAVGAGGQTGGSRSALLSLVGRPFGQTLLVIIALGLAGFAAWRVLEAVTDADREGSSWKGYAIRGAHLLSGFIYGGLAVSTFGIVLGSSRGGSEDAAARDWTAWLLSQPFGQWLTAIGGLVVAGAGLGFIWLAWKGQVMKHLVCDAQTARWAVVLGRLGFAARGVVFVMIGGFLVLAAIRSNSAQVKGLGGSLETLEQQPYGWFLLALVAAGLLAFGVFGIVQALYRRIDAPDLDDAKAAAREGISTLTG